MSSDNKKTRELILALTIGILIGQMLTMVLTHERHSNSTLPHLKQQNIPQDITHLIKIETPIELQLKRAQLNEYLWGMPALDTEVTPSVQKNYIDKRYAETPGLKRIDRFVHQMDSGIKSIGYYFTPLKEKASAAVIYHQGHRGDFYHGKKIISQLLSAGYPVAALSMPLSGMNNRPVVTNNRFGKIAMTDHDKLIFAVPKNGSTMKFFVEPVISTVNFLKQLKKDKIAMIGLSGGGWTTHISAAIDPRIDLSIPVAGSIPIHLRGPGNEWGDYEQTNIDFYTIANYPELYLLGSYGEERQQMQVLIVNDPCCFGGRRHKQYETIVQNKLSLLGPGIFSVLSDDTIDEHQISTYVMSNFLELLNNLR